MPKFRLTWTEVYEVVADSEEDINKMLDEGQTFNESKESENFKIELIPE